MIKDLSQFDIGEKGVVKAVRCQGVSRRRLFDMGVTMGTDIVLIKRAPLGDPIEIKIRNYSLTLRMDQAKDIEMEVK